MKDQEELIQKMHLGDDNQEMACTSEDLEMLRLSGLKCGALENNPLFIQLRGSLV